MTVAATGAAPARVAAAIPADPFDLLPRDAVVAVAMSGGVDSSVAAARCAAAGVRAFGITLAMWPRDRERERDRGCCSVDAVEDARRVAGTLGIAHYTWNLEPEFEREVVARYAEGYAAGTTPNPCVSCNQSIKFGVLLERARAAGASHLATGHYARIGRRGAAATLHRAVATAKDQAYTLHRLDQDQLRATVLPLGADASKPAVRGEAERLGLVTAAKPDSQELCFVEGTVAADLAVRLSGRFREGPIVDTGGTVLGAHRGLPFYTVGQRSGLGIAPSRPDSAPLFVVAVDAATNTVIVGPREALARDEVTLDDLRWVGDPPALGESLELQLRAHARATPVTVARLDGSCLTVACRPPVTQVAPGQSGVLYDGDEVLGGGTVTRA